MSNKRWMCAVIKDQRGDIMIGTNGTVLRIRRPGEVPIECELKNCQTTPREKLASVEFQVDPLFTKAEELQKLMDDQRKGQEEEFLRKKKHGLKTSIQAAMHGLAEDK
jgi:hypothetical protein